MNIYILYIRIPIYTYLKTYELYMTNIKEHLSQQNMSFCLFVDQFVTISGHLPKYRALRNYFAIITLITLKFRTGGRNCIYELYINPIKIPLKPCTNGMHP